MNHRHAEQERHALCQVVDLVALVHQATYHRLTRRGRSFVGCCPVCRREKATLRVCPKSQIWRCSTCKEEGDAVDLMRRIEATTNRRAIARLRWNAAFLTEACRDAERIPIPLWDMPER